MAELAIYLNIILLQAPFSHLSVPTHSTKICLLWIIFCTSIPRICFSNLSCSCFSLSLLWHCWLSNRKSVWPVIHHVPAIPKFPLETCGRPILIWRNLSCSCFSLSFPDLTITATALVVVAAAAAVTVTTLLPLSVFGLPTPTLLELVRVWLLPKGL